MSLCTTLERWLSPLLPCIETAHEREARPLYSASYDGSPSLTFLSKGWVSLISDTFVLPLSSFEPLGLIARHRYCTDQSRWAFNTPYFREKTRDEIIAEARAMRADALATIWYSDDYTKGTLYLGLRVIDADAKNALKKNTLSVDRKGGIFL